MQIGGGFTRPVVMKIVILEISGTAAQTTNNVQETALLRESLKKNTRALTESRRFPMESD